MNTEVNEFIVNSRGQCFFCLSKVKFKSSSVKSAKPYCKPDSSSGRLYTIQCLSEYLKMDLTKVFSQKESIDPSLLAKVEQSKLKTELCAACASLATNFSRLHQQFEKLKMEMDHTLGHIQEKLRMAENLWTPAQGEIEEDEGLIEILKVLRKEAMEKCSDRIGRTSMPRVRIQKLSRKAVNAELEIRRRGTRNKEAEPKNMQIYTEARSQIANNVKMEIQSEDSALEGEGSGYAFLDDATGISDEDESMEQTATEISESAEEKTSTVVTVTPSGNSEELKYIINPETGKHKCLICSKEFSQGGFSYHYKSVHLKIRFKCNLCGKIFRQKPHYNSHLKRDHLGVTFRCLVCNQEFNYKDTLNKHQQKNMCQAGNV